MCCNALSRLLLLRNHKNRSEERKLAQAHDYPTDGRTIAIYNINNEHLTTTMADWSRSLRRQTNNEHKTCDKVTMIDKNYFVRVTLVQLITNMVITKSPASGSNQLARHVLISRKSFTRLAQVPLFCALANTTLRNL